MMAENKWLSAETHNRPSKSSLAIAADISILACSISGHYGKSGVSRLFEDPRKARRGRRARIALR
jgi:hypothetical protein